MNIPAMALLRRSTGNVIFSESHTAIIAPGVGAPISTITRTINIRDSSEVPNAIERGVARTMIRMIVEGSSPVKAPTSADRHKIGALSNCSWQHLPGLADE